MLGSLTVAETEQVKQVSAIQAVKIKTINFLSLFHHLSLKNLNLVMTFNI